jgi:phosphatidylglycerol:prolipoprotein diacylglycerol transferase
MNASPAYGVLLLVGLLTSAWLWSRLGRPRPEMLLVYAAGLLGAFLGAKLGYLLAELPFHLRDANVFEQALTGKTITTGLLGGYAGVEIGKKLVGHRKATGDLFAVVVPVGLFFGRIGCYLHGCCPGIARGSAWFTVTDAAGVSRWPATLVEAGFNLAAAAVLFALWKRRALPGQLFHVYLIAYGAFRFAHEFFRDTPRIGPGLSPYQLLALLLVGFGSWRFAVRRAANRLNTALAAESIL